jgi:PAS domain S-box-containing protein
MNIDLRTLAIVLGIINVLQVVGLFLQYLVNRIYRGVGWWLLWSASTAIGFMFLLLRDVVSSEMISISIIFANALLLAGQIFLYVGIMRFLERKEHRGIVISIFTFFILSTFYAVYVNRDENARALILYVSASVISFLTAQALLVHKPRSIAASANFLSAFFLLYGLYFSFRTVVALTVDPVDSVFTPTLIQIATFLIPLVVNSLWAFGLIIMFNQRSNAEIGEAKENLELILNTSPDAVMVTRLSDGNFVKVNDGFTLLSGYSRAETIDKSTVDLNLWHDPADRYQIVKMLGQTGFCENLEIVFRRKDGTQLTALFFAKIINLHGTPHIISVTRDITERQKVESELRKLSRVVEQSQVSVVITDTGGVIEYVNPKFCEITGYSFEEVLGENPRILRSVAAPREVYKELWETITAGHKWQGRFCNQKKNGQLFWESAIISPILNEHGVITHYMAVKEDITERKQVEETLLKLTAIEERQRLARDLHDSVNQSIHGMVLFSETLVATLDKNNMDRARQIAERLQESARQALKETRLMLYEMQPSDLERSENLIRDLEIRLQTVERHAGVKAHIVLEGSMENCPQEWHENLFWITIEALNNAMKHAQARNIQILVHCFPQHMKLEVTDDGKGFDPDKPRSGGLGLHNMHERAHLLGGELTIISTPGKGSRVCFNTEIEESL